MVGTVFGNMVESDTEYDVLYLLFIIFHSHKILCKIMRKQAVFWMEKAHVPHKFFWFSLSGEPWPMVHLYKYLQEGVYTICEGK